MERPNVMVIMSDQLKATASHLYGNPFCRTPALEKLAREGVLFQNAITPHPLCVPARVSLWTGQYSHAHGARRNETMMPAGAVHAFRLWKGEGWHTGLIGKNHCFAEQDDLALFDTWCEIGHEGLPEPERTWGLDWVRPAESIRAAHAVRRDMAWQSPRLSYAMTHFPLEDRGTGLIAAQTVRFLEQHQEDPFALWVSFPDPHTPYEAPEQYARLFLPDRAQFPPRREGEFDHAPERNRVLHRILGMDQDRPEDVYNVLAVYYGMVRFLDDAVGWILEALERLSLAKRTIVVFCADHGDFSGEHRMMQKGGVFYDCLTRVPLIVAWPGHIPSGQVDDSLVNLVDVAPMLLRLQGLPIPRSMQGAPLPTVTESPPREAAFSEYGAGGPPFRLVDLGRLPSSGWQALMDSLQWREAEGRRKMIRTRTWKYVHDPMGDLDELYDLDRDPWELENVADRAENQAVMAELQSKLMDWSIMTEDARPVPLPQAHESRPQVVL
jgi:arylsulfatase A-like enzyme